jgi:hypothetical protein
MKELLKILPKARGTGMRARQQGIDPTAEGILQRLVVPKVPRRNTLIPAHPRQTPHSLCNHLGSLWYCRTCGMTL